MQIWPIPATIPTFSHLRILLLFSCLDYDIDLRVIFNESDRNVNINNYFQTAIKLFFLFDVYIDSLSIVVKWSQQN